MASVVSLNAHGADISYVSGTLIRLQMVTDNRLSPNA
jgi:hypothetical protein